MHYDISFPHLGIHLEHVGKTISVFGFEIAYYGIIIGTAILLGFVIATSEAKRTGQDPESYLDMGMFGVVFGIIGARLYYVLFSWVHLIPARLSSISSLMASATAMPMTSVSMDACSGRIPGRSKRLM